MAESHSACRLCVALIFAALLVGDAFAANLYSTGSDSEDAVLGKRIFERNCTYCHGPAGTGGKVKPLYRSTLTPEQLFQITANGKIMDGNVMPGWKNSLTVDEIRQLVAYMVSLRNSELPK